MQKNEVIIKQFVKTIKESPLDVECDPLVLSKVLQALAKKKKRRIFSQIFLLLTFVSIGLSFVVWGSYYRNTELKESKSIIGSLKHQALDVQKDVSTLNDLKEKNGMLRTKTSNKTTSKKQDDYFTNVISYKFNNHQIDIFKEGTEEFIQINIFGADGREQDVLKIMEDLKKSYKKNEVYVDSVKHK